MINIVYWFQVWNLKLTIGNLVMSMIEENTAESLLVAKVTVTMVIVDDDDGLLAALLRPTQPVHRLRLTNKFQLQRKND